MYRMNNKTILYTSADIRAGLVRDYAEREQQIEQLNVKLN